MQVHTYNVQNNKLQRNVFFFLCYFVYYYAVVYYIVVVVGFVMYRSLDIFDRLVARELHNT